MLINNKIPIYVIGYPKSGNTWLTRLVGDALNSPTGSGYLKHQSEIASEGYDRPGQYFVLKSHQSKKFNETPSFNKDSYILYIVRDFRDVLISSFFHHYRIDEDLVLLDEFCTKKSLSQFIWRNFIFNLEMRKLTNGWGSLSGGTTFFHFIKGILRGRWLHDLKGGYVGSWSDHIATWSNFSSREWLIRYEDLLENPLESVVNAFEKLNIKFDIERLKRAINTQSFANRKKEFLAKNDSNNILFMRKGISGDWKRFLSPKMLRCIYLKHGKTMKEYGYTR